MDFIVFTVEELPHSVKAYEMGKRAKKSNSKKKVGLLKVQLPPQQPLQPVTPCSNSTPDNPRGKLSTGGDRPQQPLRRPPLASVGGWSVLGRVCKVLSRWAGLPLSPALDRASERGRRQRASEDGRNVRLTPADGSGLVHFADILQDVLFMS